MRDLRRAVRIVPLAAAVALGMVAVPASTAAAGPSTGGGSSGLRIVSISNPAS